MTLKKGMGYGLLWTLVIVAMIEEYERIHAFGFNTFVSIILMIVGFVLIVCLFGFINWLTK